MSAAIVAKHIVKDFPSGGTTSRVLKGEVSVSAYR
jgi:hypothetical protein